MNDVDSNNAMTASMCLLLGAILAMAYALWDPQRQAIAIGLVFLVLACGCLVMMVDPRK